MSLALAITASAAGPAAAFGQCAPRVISKNIKDAVLAMKAAQYCEGLPYTINQAAHQVEAMRCSDTASEIIDRLQSQTESYRLLLTGSAGTVGCAQAAQIQIPG